MDGKLSSKMFKRCHNGYLNLDQSFNNNANSTDLLNISESEKFIIQWSTTTTTTSTNKNIDQFKSKHSNHIIDYFANLPDYDGGEACGLLTQVCQTTSLRDDLNDEKNLIEMKKAKKCKNKEERNRSLLNGLINDMNEFNRYFTNFNDDQEKENQKQDEFNFEVDDKNVEDDEPIPESPPPKMKLQKDNERTSTPMAVNHNLKKKETQQQQQKQNGISDDSLIIALSQFEAKPPPPTRKRLNTESTTFQRYKSDPLHNNQQNERKIYSSQRLNDIIDDDDDDDDVNLLFHNENLLKLIDSQPQKSSVQQQQQKQPPMIQVPCRTGLKIQRMSSNENLQTHQANANIQTLKSKNFYGAQPSKPQSNNNTKPITTQSKPPPIKYTQEQIELKRQQALTRLKQKLTTGN